MNKLACALTFVAGAAIGSAATWYITKTKYEKIANEEIESVKEVFSTKEIESSESESDEEDEEDPTDIQEKASQAKEKPSVIEYASRITKEGYKDYSVTKEKPVTKNIFDEVKELEEAELNSNEPYVISPDEFDTIDEYETISLTLYSDGVLTDDLNEPVEDIDEVVGEESLDHFGEYEDDSVFVRNDRLKADYEILRDLRKYVDVIKEMPHNKGVL